MRHEKERGGATTLLIYDSYWNPIEKNAGYNKQNNSYDVSPFIRDYLSIKQKKITGMKDIYTEFKA